MKNPEGMDFGGFDQFCLHISGILLTLPSSTVDLSGLAFPLVEKLLPQCQIFYLHNLIIQGKRKGHLGVEG